MISKLLLNLVLVIAVFLQPLPAIAQAYDSPADPTTEVPSADAQNGLWSPIISLRDNTDTFPGTDEIPKPEGGWWVAPIHASLLPSGEVIVTGWSRPQERQCVGREGRRFGTSFLLDPAELTTVGETLNITPIDEQPQLEGDVLYCSGHTPLPDGSILYMGGAKYNNLGDRDQDEFGLNYARIFDGEKFVRIPTPNPGGPTPPADGSWDWYETGMMWYPNITRIPGGRALINGGLAKWASVLDSRKWEYQNDSMTLFDFDQYQQGQNPWTIWVNDANAPREVSIDVFDYAHAMLLPQPVEIDGRDRHVVIYGGIANDPDDGAFTPGLAFLSLDETVPEEERFTTPAEGKRPGGGLLNETTAFLTTEGEIVIIGGGDNGLEEGQRIDKFDPETMQWTSLDMGSTRHKAASTLLPDGTALIISGEEFYQADKNIGDLKQPMIYDPQGNTLTQLAPWTDDDQMRGYHNVSLLLKDGRVLIGGGRVFEDGQEGDYRIGCERPELRLFSPPYLFNGPRPEITAVSDGKLTLGESTMTVTFASASLPASGGAALMALGAMTHSFDQGQRRVALEYRQMSDYEIEIMAPENAFAAPEGMYNLFLISEDGVPSVAQTVEVVSP
ncbi:MAG: galactose oxidase-like domain-containing protein [Elainellaceae cyanobacterium]